MSKTPLWKVLLLLVCSLALCSLVACKAASDDDDDDSGDSTPDSSADSGSSTAPELRSMCGVMQDLILHNPYPAGMAERVTVDALSANQVVITRQEGINAGGQQAVKLHGIQPGGTQTFYNTRGVATIRSLTSGGAYFVPAGVVTACPFSNSGGVGIYGQLYSLSGESVNEELIADGLAVSQIDPCGADALVGCYNSIEVEEQFSSQFLSRFLWKPVAERDGNLVVLTSTRNATIEVQGAISQTLTNFGPSNGFGQTARSNRPGSAFGSNIRVTVRDSNGLIVRTPSGESFVTVPNGASRFEF